MLERAGIEDPRLNAERLLGHVLGVARADMYAHPDRGIEEDGRKRYEALLRRRCGHEPLQYLLGETEFMSLRFRVMPGVLIPRPETEILVEVVAGSLSGRGETAILDVGTGSGCIAVSLAFLLPDARISGIDVSETAVRVARENAARNGVSGRVRFDSADVNSESFPGARDAMFDAVVSNPPYVSLAGWSRLPEEIRGHEPRGALCDEGDGLSFYRLLASKAKRVLFPGGHVFFEVGDGQDAAVESILSEQGYRDVEAYPDLNGIRRVIRGRRHDDA